MNRLILPTELASRAPPKPSARCYSTAPKFLDSRIALLAPVNVHAVVCAVLRGEVENTQPHLERRLGLLNATSINMSNMVGSGIFITLPLILGAMGGPQALLGWFLGAAIAIADALVWSELSAAFPGSGGSYVYLLNSFGRDKWGLFWAFLFIFQMITSGPLEIASGNIGIAQYVGY